MEQFVDVTVEVIGDYQLRRRHRRRRRLHRPRLAGRIRALRDPAYFARVEADPEAGTIVWPDGPDMAPEPLYAEARRNLVSAARARPDRKQQVSGSGVNTLA